MDPDGFCSFSAGLLGVLPSDFSGTFGSDELAEFPDELFEPEALG